MRACVCEREQPALVGGGGRSANAHRRTLKQPPISTIFAFRGSSQGGDLTYIECSMDAHVCARACVCVVVKALASSYRVEYIDRRAKIEMLNFNKFSNEPNRERRASN